MAKTNLIAFFVLCLFLFGCNSSNTIWNYNFEIISENEDYSFLRYENQNERIDLKKFVDVSEPAASKITKDKVLMFKSLFEIQRTGYPGQQTTYIECPEKFKPSYYEINITNGWFNYFIGYANSNYVSGACSDDLIKYHNVYGFLYCEDKKTLIEIQHFSDISDTDKKELFLSKIDCSFH
jgi:hypothetical protein